MEVIVEKPCAKPGCGNGINSELKKVRFCGPCQMYLADLQMLFPNQYPAYLAMLYVEGRVHFSQAARILEEHPSTFRDRLQRGDLETERSDGHLYISLESLIFYQEERQHWIRLSEAARLIGYDLVRLRYLAYAGSIPTIRLNKFYRVKRSKLQALKHLCQELAETQYSRKWETRRKPRRNNLLSTRQMADILGCSQEAITPHIRSGRLIARKRKANWYSERSDFENFCRELLSRKFSKLRHSARVYLDSIAAG